MKCVKCGTSNKLFERNVYQGRCKNCGREFTFEPLSMTIDTRITDPFFANLISKVSANETLFFTATQLYYLLNKKLLQRSGIGDLGSNLLIYLGGGTAFLFFGSFLAKGFLKLPFDLGVPILAAVWFVYAIGSISLKSISERLDRRTRYSNIETLKIFAVLLGASAILIAILVLPTDRGSGTLLGIAESISLSIAAIALYFDRRNRQKNIFNEPLIDRAEFDRYLTRWNDINGASTKLLPELTIDTLPPAIDSEITAYSFDRVIVCDRAEIAKLLIANNFHFEHNCAILAIDGYPQAIFETTMSMLRRNPDLKIYALHDCSPGGIQLAHQLRADDWFPDPNLAITDVGIWPRQIVDTLDSMWLKSDRSAQAARALAAEVRATLSPVELAWLDAGCYLELESFSSQKLLQILHRAISQQIALGSIEEWEAESQQPPIFYPTDSFG